MVKVKIKDSKAYLYTPYNPQFMAEIRGIGGASWDRAERAWSIPPRSLDIAREIMLRIFGEADQIGEPERVSVRLTFSEVVREWRAPVVIMGKTIASAFGRDSYARVGPDAAFTAGAPEAGGSMKNWYTIIPSGCRVTLYNVPRAMLNSELPDGVTYEIIEDPQGDPEIKRKALMEERGALRGRLEEINEILGE